MKSKDRYLGRTQYRLDGSTEGEFQPEHKLGCRTLIMRGQALLAGILGREWARRLNDRT
jgi:hypothetical protein